MAEPASGRRGPAGHQDAGHVRHRAGSALLKLPHPPAIIFTTAYDQFALRAFEVNAVDYLLQTDQAGTLAAALTKKTALPP